MFNGLKKYRFILIRQNSLLILCLLIVNVVYSQRISEYELKSRHLFNFVSFVDWSTSENPTTIPFSIAIYGTGPFGKDPYRAALKQILEEKNRNEWYVKNFPTIKDIDDCHILFIPKFIKKSELIKVVRAVKGKPILIVCDEVDDFCSCGGMINFKPRGSSTLFEINEKVAREAKLIIDLRLLIIGDTCY